MQLKNSILPLLSFASLLTATPVPSLSARSEAGCFEVTQFRDSGSPHSIEAQVYFLVTDASTGVAATCSANLAIQPTIVTADFPTVCNDTSVVFGLEYNPKLPGYWFIIGHLYNNNNTVDTGSLWLGGDIRRYNDPLNPNGDYDYLNFPASFSVAYNRHVQEKPTTTSAAAGTSPTA
ncbi:hypothetical protein TWF694_006456 [Orbilia ellipsospora]|uniref:Uncharacterized protein n=1 Tax=Orbilia ellipsospora TaxID=2528407 RepID=A0AAV9XMQ5_9PEZI